MFRREVPGMYVSAKQKDWIGRFLAAHTVFIVVAGLIFTSTFNAVNSYDSMAPSPVSLYFRAFSTVGFCLSAFSIVC